MDLFYESISKANNSTYENVNSFADLDKHDCKLHTITCGSTLLLRELISHNIRFAHWKSNNHLLKSLEGKTDLDLLVHPIDSILFEDSMKSLGYKKLISQPWSRYPKVEDWLGFDNITGQFLHIHTHYTIVTGIQHVKHLYLPWTEIFFKHVIIDKETGWPIPRPDLEAIILFIRIWAKMPPLERLKKNQKIPYYIQEELLDLLKRSSIDVMVKLCQELQLFIPYNFSCSIKLILENKNPQNILRISELLYNQLKPYYRISWTVALLKSYYYKVHLKITKISSKVLGPNKYGKTLFEGGKLIALIGSDGSGKSTLSKDLITWLTYKIDTHYFYLGKNPFIKSYNKKIFFISDLLFLQNTLSKYLKRAIGDFFYVALISKKLDLLQKAKKMSSAGSLIICDRFPQKDILGMNDGPNLYQSKNKWSTQAEMKIFHKISEVEPDIVLRLQVTPEVASSRKPEHNKNLINLKCQYIDRISFKSALVININANQPYDQVLLEAKRIIWKIL